MKRNGFTLVEVLAVISILGVIAILVVPSLLNLFQQSKHILNDYEKTSIMDSGRLYMVDLDNGIKSYNGLTGYDFKKYVVSEGNITVSLETLIKEGYYDSSCTSYLCKKIEKSKLDDSSPKIYCDVVLGIEVKEENGFLVTSGYTTKLTGKDCE